MLQKEEAFRTRVSNKQTSKKPEGDKQVTQISQENLAQDIRKYIILHWKANFKSPRRQNYPRAISMCASASPMS